MGMAATVIGGALAGLGVALFGKKSKGPSTGGMQSDFGNVVASAPQTPQAPIVPETGQKSDSMLAAEEEERKRRLAEAEANETNYSGGLGVTTPANVGRKTLLG